MLLDVSPLKKFRDYRFLYIGQFVSLLGNMMSYVALPFQIYSLTKSSFAIGMMGVVQLAPLLLTALVGGAFADALDRRKLIIGAEIGLMVCALLLTANAYLPRPQLWLIYVLAGLSSALVGFHRPALDSLTPRLVDRESLAAVSALNPLKSTIGMIGGPALGGILIANYGVGVSYGLNSLSFLISLVALAKIKSIPALGGSKLNVKGTFKRIAEGLAYARSRPELLGTYIVDFIAMIFGMPTALFPAISENLGGPKVLGWLYSGISIGAFAATVTSGWTKKISRHGAGIFWAAGIWGVAIILFGFAKNIWIAVILLAVAGAADMVSGIFRGMMWNQTIPDQVRGRLVGLEMISYMSGPLLGNAESGIVASISTTQVSVISGGILCVLGVFISVWIFPQLWHYEWLPNKTKVIDQPNQSL